MEEEQPKKQKALDQNIVFEENDDGSEAKSIRQEDNGKELFLNLILLLIGFFLILWGNEFLSPLKSHKLNEFEEQETSEKNGEDCESESSINDLERRRSLEEIDPNEGWNW